VHKRYVAPLLVCFALAVPASASAHARSATVALDYRLVLDRASLRLPGVGVEILDGDRSIRLSVSSSVVVLGDLDEPMLRIDSSGAWANRASVTAVAERLVQRGTGWHRVGGSTFAWHDHRLAPPPYSGGRVGVVARFRVPVRVTGRPAAIAGAFVRYHRPAVWPWLGIGTFGLGVAVATRRQLRRRRSQLTIALGCLAGLAAIVSLGCFGAADSPTGRAAWLQLAPAGFLAIVAAIGVIRLTGERRVLLASLIGGAAAATSLGSLGAFRHAVVVSALPAVSARAVSAVAFTAGLAAASGLIIGRGRS
jgi:hypothetical protein